MFFYQVLSNLCFLKHVRYELSSLEMHSRQVAAGFSADLFCALNFGRTKWCENTSPNIVFTSWVLWKNVGVYFPNFGRGQRHIYEHIKALLSAQLWYTWACKLRSSSNGPASLQVPMSPRKKRPVVQNIEVLPTLMCSLSATTSLHYICTH